MCFTTRSRRVDFKMWQHPITLNYTKQDQAFYYYVTKIGRCKFNVATFEFTVFIDKLVCFILYLNIKRVDMLKIA